MRTKPITGAWDWIREKILAAALMAVAGLLVLPPAHAQGSRKDDIVFGPSGHPMAGATVRVCLPTATGTPCSPLATIFTDATLSVQAANPFQADGLGNYHFYAPAGRYQIQISGPGITGAITYPDVILAADLSSSGAGNNISAFGLTLGGNLTVGGNATVTGTLSTTNFNPGNFTPSSMSVGGNESVAGPRPRVDVTAYGVKGDAIADDTAAIQAAINAACLQSAGGDGGGTLYFPPAKSVNGVGGTYIITQTQLPSTSPIFNIPCSGVHFLGGNSFIHGGQFGSAPSVSLTVSRGANPNNAPVFQATNGDTFENLVISGYNQVIAIGSGSGGATSGVMVKHVNAIVQTTGQANNCPYVLSNTLFDSFKDSNFQTGSTQYGFCIVDTNSAQPVGLISMDFAYSAASIGCLISYTSTVNSAASGPGNWAIRNFTGEVCNSDLIAISNGGFSVPLISNIALYNVGMSDSSCTNCALINLNASGTLLQGVTAYSSTIGNGGAGVFIRRTAGSVIDAHSNCGSSFCVSAIVDASGNPTGIGDWNAPQGGREYVSNGTDATRLQSHYTGSTGSSPSPSERFFTQGNIFSGMGLDPIAGVVLSDRTNYGYNAGIAETTQNGIDISFAQIVPPASLAGTATTGGSLAAASYYFSLRTTKDNCTSLSAPSLEAGPVVVGGANNAVNLTWTLPPTTANSPGGYCLYTSTAPGSAATSGSIFISGGSTASFLYTGQSKSGGLGVYYNSLTAVHRFTPTSLGIGLTAPAYNLDLASGYTAHFPSYFDVTETAAPVNPASGVERWYGDSTSHLMSCRNSAGGNCAPAGGGSATFQVNGTNTTSQTTINFQNSAAFNGLTFTFANPSAGNIQLGASGTLANAGLVNSSLTYNGQAVALGASGNVNSGAAAHSVAVNEGNGSAITGLALGAHQTVIGAAGADPSAKTVPDCLDSGGNHLNYAQSTDTFSCGTTSSGGGGAASVVQNSFTAGTVTSGNLACFTASNTVGNCTSFPPNNFLGVFYNGTGGVQSQGLVTVNLDATVNVTFGDIVCASSASAKGHDNGSTACANGEWVGIVETTATSVSAATVFLKLP
jgi:hypothetical protein